MTLDPSLGLLHAKQIEHLICHSWTLSVDWNVYTGRRDAFPKPLLVDCHTIINLLLWEKFLWKSWYKNFFFAPGWHLQWLGVWAVLELMELGVWSLEEGANRPTRGLELDKMCDRTSYKDIFHSYIEVHSLCFWFFQRCVDSREVWTLGMLKQKRYLAYHERTRLSSMFSLKLQDKLGSLPVSNTAGLFLISHTPTTLTQLGCDSWENTGNGLMELIILYGDVRHWGSYGFRYWRTELALLQEEKLASRWRSLLVKLLACAHLPRWLQLSVSFNSFSHDINKGINCMEKLALAFDLQ